MSYLYVFVFRTSVLAARIAKRDSLRGADLIEHSKLRIAFQHYSTIADLTTYGERALIVHTMLASCDVDGPICVGKGALRAQAVGDN